MLATWTCIKCVTRTSANPAHPRITSGDWKSGSTEKMRCPTCKKTTIHMLEVAK